jgi:hypothetical protein
VRVVARASALWILMMVFQGRRTCALRIVCRAENGEARARTSRPLLRRRKACCALGWAIRCLCLCLCSLRSDLEVGEPAGGRVSGHGMCMYCAAPVAEGRSVMCMCGSRPVLPRLWIQCSKSGGGACMCADEYIHVSLPVPVQRRGMREGPDGCIYRSTSDARLADVMSHRGRRGGACV